MSLVSNRWKAEALFSAFHQILAISFTTKCTIECKHCGVDSGPTKKELIDLTTICRRLTEAAGKGTLKAIQISGGEPFSEKDALRHILEVANKCNLYTIVHTNAFWAKDYESAENTLRNLAGISQLQISTDKYHSEFIPLKYVRSAALAAINNGLPCQIAVCNWSSTRDYFYTELCNVLGEDLLREVDIVINKILPLGRAQLLPEAKLVQMERSLPAGRCSLLNRPVVLEDGTVSACCNHKIALSYSDSPLRIGNLRDESLHEITEKASNDSIIQAIRIGGPKFLASILIGKGSKDKLSYFYERGSICDLCRDILSKPDLVSTLKEALQDPDVQAELAGMQAIVLGETQPLQKLLRLE